MKYVLAAAALAASVALPASANCNPAKLAGTFNEANYVYIDMGPGMTNAQVVGSFYALGDTNANNGTYGANEWLFVDLNGLLSMQANLGDARVNGCPSGTLITRVYSPSATPVRFLTLTAVEGAAGTSSAFDYSFGRAAGSILSAVPLPRPRPVASTRVSGSVILITWLIDSTSGGNTGEPAGAVTGYELVRAAGTVDPGRDPSAWSVVATVASDGSQTVFHAPADCGAIFADEFFATRLLFNDGQKSPIVSLSTRINCHPTMAEPDFRIVPKHPSGPRKLGPAR